ncbi:MAG: hypothetical protein IKO42_06630, partial [Opitutales bacterium]|nr:hypothetical protein [Opitutales bacterium]
MKNCKKYSIFALAAMAGAAAFAGNSYRVGDDDADWSDIDIWSPAYPTSSDTANLDSELTTNFTLDTTVASVTVKGNATLNVESGTLTTTGDFNQAYSTVNIFGGEIKVGGTQYTVGETNDAIDGSRLNVYGEGVLNVGVNNKNGIRIGYNAVNYDVEANFYDNSAVAGRIRIGSETSGSNANTTLNVYGNSVVTADYVNLYQNATLNVYGSAQINASSDLRWGDMTASTANAVNISGNASVAARGGFIFDGATVTVSDNASLITNGGNGNNLYLGADWNKASSGAGHLIFEDSATFRVSQNLIFLNGSTLTIKGSHLQMAEG